MTVESFKTAADNHASALNQYEAYFSTPGFLRETDAFYCWIIDRLGARQVRPMGEGTVLVALLDQDRVLKLYPPFLRDHFRFERAALQGLRFGGDDGDPEVDADWGEPGLTPAERVIAWNTLEVLAYRTGNPDHPVNAIPPAARAAMHLRFVVGTDVTRLREHVQAHLVALTQALAPWLPSARRASRWRTNSRCSRGTQKASGDWLPQRAK